MLVSIEQLKKEIASGKVLLLAGDEELLKKLPRGNWIGGTIPYFMDTGGGVSTRQSVFMTELAAPISMKSIEYYSDSQLASLPQDTPDPGFSFLILPANSAAHLAYAQNAPNYKDIFLKPIIGWIAGIHLDDLGKITPKVFDGLTGESSDAQGIAMHCSIPSGNLPSIGIINIFKQGSGDVITFENEGFSVNDVLVNGKKRNLAEYLTANKIDTKLPLVANYCGTMVNVSFQSVNEAAGTVDLYAPVFRGVEYKIAAPIGDYVKEFSSYLSQESKRPVFSCNCILNYLYSQLEGKKTGGFTGPITFGEIAYQLLNQTLVYLEIK